ncbi:MAG: heparan-alpha-glucosaminide N-acetyltransferase domain-containing protein, partial [Candidatus Bathyarchaeota archaeon]|nr:heparan-alpha-glucosaminide N-acetyltransferase domain-containing protein [Candidatus Bathyarchaeota archaeon]
MKRIESVDAVRGFSVLWMIFFQIMDFFSRDHVMSVNFSRPSAFWLATLDYVNWLPPFLFVSGVSVWLMMKKRLSNSSKLEVWLHGAKRYGFYLLLSFLLCIWCFNLDTFLYLNEIIGAIAVYALIALTISLIFYGREREISLLLGGILCGVGLFLAGAFEGVLKYSIYRFYWTLPFFFFGLYSAAMIASKSTRKLAIAGTAFLSLGMLTSLLLEQKISYSERTF